MPITTSTEWKRARLQTHGRFHVVLKLVGGGTTWYLSDKEMELSDGHVHQVILDWGRMQSGFDLFSKKTKVVDLTFRLTNLRYKRDKTADGWIRLSDELTAIRNTTAEVYFLVGERFTALSDCLKRYTGTVIDQPIYNQDTLSIRIVNKGAIINKKLPSRLVGDIYTTAPKDMLKQHIPIVYGEFTYNADHDGSGLGMAIGAKKNFGVNSQVFADHVIDAFTDLYAKDSSLPDPVQFQVKTLNLNDAGRGTATGVTALCHAAVYPDSTDGLDVYTDFPTSDVLDIDKATDRDTTTFVVLFNNKVTGVNPGTAPEGLLYGSFSAEAFLVDQSERAGKYKFKHWVDDPYASVITSKKLRLYNASGTPDTFDEQNLGTSGSYQLVPGTFQVLPLTGKTNPFVLGILIVGKDADANGVVNLIDIMEFLLIIEYTIREAGKIFGVLKGREYGSWISSRSSNYASGNVIEDPAGIIESVLRDELSLVDADLDLPSFITAENTSVKARINLHSENQMTAFDVIRQIAEQSTLAFTWGTDGIARCVDLDDKTPTTDRTIPYSHLRNGRIVVKKTHVIRNKMHILSRWQEELGKHADDTTNSPIEDTTSQTDFGTFEYNASWKNIAGTTVTTVSGHLVNSTDGIWSKEHIQIEFETLGVIHADLVEGDWIELESTSFDEQVKAPGGVTWSGIQFLITNVAQGKHGTAFIAIELW